MIKLTLQEKQEIIERIPLERIISFKETILKLLEDFKNLHISSYELSKIFPYLSKKRIQRYYNLWWDKQGGASECKYCGYYYFNLLNHQRWCERNPFNHPSIKEKWKGFSDYIYDLEKKIENQNKIIEKLQNPFNIPLGYDKLPDNYYQSNDWKKTEIMILKRDKWKCKIKGFNCMGTGNFVHHIRSPKNNPQIANAHWNLETICKNCHGDIYKNHKT